MQNSGECETSSGALGGTCWLGHVVASRELATGLRVRRVQEQQNDSPQGSALRLRWLSERTNLVDGASNSPRLILQVSGDAKRVNMEREFEEIDSSGKWQNLYNVSRDPGPLVFL